MEVEKEAPPSLLVALLSVHLLPSPPPDLATTVAVEKAGSEGKVEAVGWVGGGGFGRADPPPAGSRAMDPPSRVVERRRKGGPAPGAATKITVATCGLESGGSTTGGLRNGGSIASNLGSGGYVLASGGEEAEGQRRTGSGDQDHSGCVWAQERRIHPHTWRRGGGRVVWHQERQPRTCGYVRAKSRADNPPSTSLGMVDSLPECSRVVDPPLHMWRGGGRVAQHQEWRPRPRRRCECLEEGGSVLACCTEEAEGRHDIASGNHNRRQRGQGL
uniref:Uncharacterized protein n=4 Tax=Oryza sativa subsp. japonica TaxID=39947 RepID=A0A5S6R6I8_ORYSJ|nr:Hypothetical protein [Oryza sativa Japonica Group]AAX95623.1 hypothetical protein [Oryza sativa Japonica Group]ABF97138.1 hypothetical protein LOC_Os03g36640 [Oryza sativa Japonica Group]